jgi:hypothetical protein
MRLNDNETRAIMASPNVTVPEELLAQARAAATAEGKTVDELTAEALKKHIAQRTLARLRRQAEAESRGMSEEQIEGVVARAIRECREESRGR